MLRRACLSRSTGRVVVAGRSRASWLASGRGWVGRAGHAGFGGVQWERELHPEQGDLVPADAGHGLGWLGDCFEHADSEPEKNALHEWTLPKILLPTMLHPRKSLPQQLYSSRRYTHQVQQQDGVDLILEQWRRERPDLDTTPMGVIGRISRVQVPHRARQPRALARLLLVLGCMPCCRSAAIRPFTLGSAGRLPSWAPPHPGRHLPWEASGAWPLWGPGGTGCPAAAGAALTSSAGSAVR